MTYLEAALAVLKGSRKPMTAAEITKSAIDRGLISHPGKTPIWTMSAALYVHARDTRGSTLRREYRVGPTGRAARGSVRWVYVK
jgi:hypothetical protein